MDYDFELQVIIEGLNEDDRIQTKEQKKWRSLIIRRCEELQAFANMLDLPPVPQITAGQLVGEQMYKLGSKLPEATSVTNDKVDLNELPEEFRHLADHLAPGDQGATNG